MPSTRKPGRPRSLDHRKKTLLCDIVARGATTTEAAFTLGVSLRTVQREARLDPDFDEKLRIAHADKPDPLAIMQSAARTHWRAAAWLLERTDPDNYGRRPASSASPAQFNAAVGQVMEAALAAVPPELRAEVYAQMQAAAEASFEAIFPGHGQWGRRHAPQAPPTPLVDQACTEQFKNPPLQRRIFDIDESRLAPPPAPITPPLESAPSTSQAPAPSVPSTVEQRAINGSCPPRSPRDHAPSTNKPCEPDARLGEPTESPRRPSEPAALAPRTFPFPGSDNDISPAPAPLNSLQELRDKLAACRTERAA
jgi:hypothetical protein